MSANDIRPKKVALTLDQERNLLYDMNAFCQIEEKLGSVQQAFEALEKMSFKGIRTLLWAGLVHEDEKLTEKQVGAMCGLPNMKLIAGAIGEALGNGLPEAKN